jgi:hypothetical protein
MNTIASLPLQVNGQVIGLTGVNLRLMERSPVFQGAKDGLAKTGPSSTINGGHCRIETS